MLNNKPFNILIVSVLSMVLFCTPAMAGIAALDMYKDNNELLYVAEISASEKDRLIEQAFNDPEIMQMINKFVTSKYELTDTIEAKWVFKERIGYVGYLVFGNSESADWQVQILYAVDKDKIVKSGAFVKRSSNIVDVYDAVDGNIYNTSTANITENEITITWKEGPLVPKSEDGTTILSTTETISPKSFPPSGECDWCVLICDAVIGGGCSVTGAIRCALVCAGNPVCIGVCTVVWAAICVIGGAAADCDANCISWGYCP